MINAEDIKVDELDEKHKTPVRHRKTDDIPEFDLGEPELEAHHSHTPEGEKRVIVDPDAEELGRHGEEFSHMTPEELEKHRKFEEMRKKHYEMKNVKNLLGHPEELLDEEDDEEPPVPHPPSNLPNGQ